jgi:hypothetical protein
MSNISENNYKNKYLKYKQKYLNLKKKTENITEIINDIIILPTQYNELKPKYKDLYRIYETNNLNQPISYIKNDYYDKYVNPTESTLNTTTTITEHDIMEKTIIEPDEYFMLSDKNKLKYDINEFDTKKYSNRVVPKNYIKI